MSGRRKVYNPRQLPKLRNAKKRADTRKKAINTLQKSNGTSEPTETEVQLQIMSDLLHQDSAGGNSLSPSEKVLLGKVLTTWLSKIQKDLNKFEHLKYSDYKDHCTIHGLYDVFISKSQLERFIWILTLIACFILAVICSKIQVNEWYQSIDTTNTPFSSWNLKLPDIIICPDLLLNKDKIDNLINGTIHADHEYRRVLHNPLISLRKKLGYYNRSRDEMGRFINYSMMIEHKEYPNIYLPFIPRSFIKKVLEFVKEGNHNEPPEMVYGNETDFYLLREFFKQKALLRMKYQHRLNLTDIAYKCDSILLTFDASQKFLKLQTERHVPHKTLRFSQSANMDEILNITGSNLTDEQILALHGVINFCHEYVKETFDYHHKCYRFDSKEIFLSHGKTSIGIILPNKTVHGLWGKKGVWISVVHGTKDLTGKLIPPDEYDGENQDSGSTNAINNLSWVYIKPGAHTIEIDATRNLILRDLPDSRCHDQDLSYNYNYTSCIQQTCDPIKNATSHECLSPILANSEVDTRRRYCMKTLNNVDAYYKECVKKCEKYCDFWTYTIADVQSQKFNTEVAGQFLDNSNDLNSRYYLKLVYQNGLYTHTEQAYKITLIEFIANIGGISGFCVGMSIMSLLQIFLYVFMVNVGHIQRRRAERSDNILKNDYRSVSQEPEETANMNGDTNLMV